MLPLGPTLQPSSPCRSPGKSDRSQEKEGSINLTMGPSGFYTLACKQEMRKVTSNHSWASPNSWTARGHAGSLFGGVIFMPRRGEGVRTMGFLSNLFGGRQAAEKTASHNENAVAEQPSTEDAPAAATGISALCPVPGTAMDIAEVADPVFSSKAMGDGIGIKPVSGELVAPFSGTVEALFPTGHALAIKNESGVGVMLHIGIDTVDMKGEGFTAHVAQGDYVEQGQLLVTFDRDKIAAAGYDDTTMVIAAEVPAGLTVATCEPGSVAFGERVLNFA
ncbi:PTS glucose transporter subunit IIA [Collinsella sp. AF08-23]|nr:PTS glucose transporter subunit IIA [Collinsella sp. AF08-23]